MRKNIKYILLMLFVSSVALATQFHDSVKMKDILHLDGPGSGATISNAQLNINNNSTAIGTNATDIGTNATNIGTNVTNIGTNVTNIGTNTTDIGTNVTAIGLNTAKVSADGVINSHSDVQAFSASDIIQDTSNQAVTAGSTGTYVQLGNQFTTAAGSQTATDLAFNTYNDTAATGNITLEVWSLSGGLPLALLGTTASIDVSTLPGSDSGLQSYPLTSSLVLSGSTQYGTVLNTTSVTGSIKARRSTSNPYPGGFALNNTGGWGNSSSTDYQFQVNLQGPPETGSFLKYSGSLWVADTNGGSGSGSGTGKTNYIKSSDASQFDDGDTAPDGTAVDTGLTIEVEATGTVSKTNSYLIQKDAVNRLGAQALWLGTDYDIAEADRGKVFYVSFKGKGITNFTDADFSAYAEDQSNAPLDVIQTDDITNDSNEYLFKIFTNTTTTSVSFGFEVETVSASAIEYMVNEIVAGPDAPFAGSIIQKTRDLSVTVTNFGTTPTVSAKYERVGNIMFGHVMVKTDVIGAPLGSINFTLDNFIIDHENLARGLAPVPFPTVGYASESNSANGETHNGTVLYDVAGAQFVAYGDDGDTQWNTSAGPPVVAATTSYYEFNFEVPIVGWDSGTLLSSQENLVKNVDIRGSGNATQFVVGNVDDIPFIITHDPLSLMEGVNNSSFRVPSRGKYRITGATAANTTTSTMNAYINGVKDISIGQFAFTGTVHQFNGEIFLEKDQLLSIRSDTSMTLANTADHWLSITSIQDNSIYGVYGEVDINSETGALATTTGGQWVDKTSFVLQPGTYNLQVELSTYAPGVSSLMNVGFSTTAGNVSPGPLGVDYSSMSLALNFEGVLSWHKKGITVTTATTYYLKVLSTNGAAQSGYNLTWEKVK